jgi:prepilin-type processing-associated H-X9-DG protein
MGRAVRVSGSMERSVTRGRISGLHRTITVVDLEFRHGTSIVGVGYADGHRHGGWPAAGVLGPSGFYHSQTGLDWILSRRVLHPVRSFGYTMLVD